MSDRLLVIAGPCVIEDEVRPGQTLEIAQELKRQLSGLPIDFYFKASFDKANRTSVDSFRGPGLKTGLQVLEDVKSKTGLNILTDIHETSQVEAVAEIVDGMQIPAFLCRQTDLIVSAVHASVRHKTRLNIKKGQFLAPWDAKNIVTKVQESEVGAKGKLSHPLSITERGASFGYNALTVDMSSFRTISSFGALPVYDATHSIQIPGGAQGGKVTGGKREILEVLARAAMAAGAQGLFLECHPDPTNAKSDGPNAFYLEHVGTFLKQMISIFEMTQGLPFLLPEAKQMQGHI